MLQTHKNKIKIIVFCAIFCLIQAPVLLSGEIMPTDLVIAVQEYLGDDFLYSKAHTEDTAYYKYQLANENAASLLVLGTSRTLQFQGFFFAEDASFYNAGLMVSNLPELLLGLQSLEEESLPDVVLIGLDEYFFNAQWYAENNTDVFAPQATSLLSLVTEGAIGVYEGIRSDSDLYWELCQGFGKIGSGAKVFDHGYDLDGGYRYGWVYEHPQDNEARVSNAVESIESATGRYYTGDTVSEDALEKLAEIADFCAEHGITLVTVTPPLSQSAIDAIDARDDMDYFYQIAGAVSAVAEEKGFEFYDFTYPETLQGSDDNFIDGFHGSDVLYLRMLIQMVQQGSCLGEYVVLEDLIEMDENAISALHIQ